MSSMYSHSSSAASFGRPVLSSLSSSTSYLMTSRLLSSSISTTEAQRAEASPAGDEGEEETEVKEEEGGDQEQEGGDKGEEGGGE